MALEQYAFDMIRDAVTGFRPFGVSWLIPMAIASLSVLFITRDSEKWKEIGLLVFWSWAIAGLKIPLWINLVLGLIFIMEYISIQQIGNVVGVVSTVTAGAIGGAYKLATKERRERTAKQNAWNARIEGVREENRFMKAIMPENIEKERIRNLFRARTIPEQVEAKRIDNLFLNFSFSNLLSLIH